MVTVHTGVRHMNLCTGACYTRAQSYTAIRGMQHELELCTCKDLHCKATLTMPQFLKDDSPFGLRRKFFHLSEAKLQPYTCRIRELVWCSRCQCMERCHYLEGLVLWCEWQNCTTFCPQRAARCGPPYPTNSNLQACSCLKMQL